MAMYGAPKSVLGCNLQTLLFSTFQGIWTPVAGVQTAVRVPVPVAVEVGW